MRAPFARSFGRSATRAAIRERCKLLAKAGLRRDVGLLQATVGAKTGLSLASVNLPIPFAERGAGRGGAVPVSATLQPMNNWNIPAWLEREVLERDRSCVYCGISFARASDLRRERRSWEHIVNDAKIITRDNIALCCIGCNASKGARTLDQWLKSRYCTDRQISAQSVSPVVRAALAMMISNEASTNSTPVSTPGHTSD